MGAVTPDYDMVTKVTIIPRSNGAGGFTLFTPSEERMESGLYSRRYLEAQLAVALGGRVAEEIVYGDDEITTGASNDLQQVMNIARRMVSQWGYAKDSLSPVAWESAEQGGMFGNPRMASPETMQQIDEEVKLLVDSAYKTCKVTLTENKALMDAVVDQLLVEETIDYQQLQDLVKEYTGKDAAGYQAEIASTR